MTNLRVAVGGALGGERPCAGANFVAPVVLCLLAVWGGHAAAAALSR